MTSNFFNFYPKRWRPDLDSQACAANRAWHAPRPRARSVVVETASAAASAAISAGTESNLQRTAGLWGTRRPSGGRARRALVRGRRCSQRVRPLGPAPDPNLTCSAYVDYFKDGQYALIIVEQGCEPELAVLMTNPGKVLYQASRFLQPGLIASVAEVVLLAIKLKEPTWNLNGPGPDRSQAGSPSPESAGPGPVGFVPPASHKASLKRPGAAGDGIVTISRDWLDAVFGPRLSKRKWLRLRFETRGLRKLRERQARDGMPTSPEPPPEPPPDPSPDPSPDQSLELPTEAAPRATPEADRKSEG